ncbi:MAG: outer membrane beta-barrel protein [Campylobacterota bacterium]
MKNSLSKIVLAAMMTAAPLVASEYTFNSHSLFAIEGGMSDVTTESAAVMEKDELANVGLKLGAQTDNYRVFLSGRHYQVEDYNSLRTYGVEAQYMFNFSEPVNFFLGANAGKAKIKVGANGADPSAETTTTYYGADAGFNLHASEMVDIEIGAKYMEMQDGVITQGATTLEVDKIVTAYASLIIKWEMD